MSVTATELHNTALQLLLCHVAAEGATATASTDSLALNRGGRGNSFAADMLTSRQSPMRRPGVVTWGVTSQGVRSGALVGATNGLVALAQVRSSRIEVLHVLWMLET